MNIRTLTVMFGLPFFALTCIVNGAVPWLMAPTNAQVIWTMGFAKSFINDGFSIYANNFGIPGPAAMSFGLAGALPAALFMKLGLLPVDAYSASFATWLGVAFIGAFGLARHLECGRPTSLLLATIWLTLPIVWVHQIFSMLALGFALLPLYFLAAIRLIKEPTVATSAFFVAACFLAVFMDGYSFMMFAVVAAVLFLASARRKEWWPLVGSAGVIAVGFGSAFAAYVAYEGSSAFDVSPIDFFRGWAVSIEFFSVPPTGYFLIPDLIGWSAARRAEQYFGDPSTYLTTFCAPLVLAALAALVMGKPNWRIWVGFSAIAAFGLYMSLGPTFKFLTYRPAGVGPLMPASYGWFETGNEWISQHLPGFTNMRASYRWAALALAAVWCLLAIGLPRISMTKRAAILAALLLLNTPTPEALHAYVAYRSMVRSMDGEIAQMQPYFKSGEKVAFLPYRNDFLANYFASDLDVNLFNAGGDKNMLAAVAQWPEAMRKFDRDTVGPNFVDDVKNVLVTGTADAVVLPYIDLLWDAHGYPWVDRYKDDLTPLAKRLADDPQTEVTYIDHFAIVRLENPG